VSRILFNEEWYEAIDASSRYESEFAAVVVAQGARLFRGYRVVKFQRTVYSDSGSARPDYALIELHYKHWWIVEVEMAHHSLEGHVIPQVSTLCNAYYGPEEAEYLSARTPELEPDRLKELLRGLPPKVLVIVNRSQPDWESALKRLGAELAVFEIFRSSRDRYAYRVEGIIPVAEEEVVSKCWLDPILPAMLRIASPGALDLPHDGTIDILWEGRLTRWKRVASQDSVWLVAVDYSPLQLSKKYELLYMSGGMLLLREALR